MTADDRPSRPMGVALPFTAVQAGMQALGQPCATCNSRIASPVEGSLCRVCKKSYHHTCAGSQRFCPGCGNEFGSGSDAAPWPSPRRGAGRRLLDWVIGRNR